VRPCAPPTDVALGVYGVARACRLAAPRRDLVADLGSCSALRCCAIDLRCIHHVIHAGDP
jgi:hypothetical protein